MKIDTSNPSNSCILRLQAVLDTLKPAEHRIAEYILQYPQDVLSSTLNELAVKSGCSYATINRLINRIGYSGFKELKRYLYQDTLVTNSLDFVDVISFSQDTSTKEICENVYNLSSKVLEDSSNIINTDSVDLAANKIISAKKVCVVGTGSSGITARYAYSRLFRIGISCSYDEDTTLFNMHASLLKKRRCAFCCVFFRAVCQYFKLRTNCQGKWCLHHFFMRLCCFTIVSDFRYQPVYHFQKCTFIYEH